MEGWKSKLEGKGNKQGFIRDFQYID